MASTATIVFTGLVYLTTLPKPTPTIMKGQIMKSPHDRVSTRGGAIPRHRAFLRVLNDDIAAKSREPDLNIAGKVLIYFLDKEDLTFSGFANGTLDFPTPGGNDTANFSAVPDVQKFCPTCRLHAEQNFDAPDFDNHVGARFAITRGSVFARRLSRCGNMPNDPVLRWNFDAEFGYPAQSIAPMPREVVLEYNIANASNLIIKTTAIAQGANPFELKLKDQKLEVTIGSATIEDILSLGSGHSDRTDHHFELFYYLLERSNAAKHPLPVADPLCAAFHRAGGVDCPPIRQ